MDPFGKIEKPLAKAKHILSVSMPRSGHHLLEMILREVLDDGFEYCEFYEEGCCKAIPCTTRSLSATTKLFLQKSHDYAFSDPVSYPGAFRVVQYRSPVPRVLSNYELYLRNGAEDCERGFRWFLVDEALYFIAFYRKWLSERITRSFLLSYEELTGDPLKAIMALFGFISLPIAQERVAEGIARAVVRRGRDNEIFVHRPVMLHRYATHPALANFETLVLERCPGYYPLRFFQPTKPTGSQIALILGAKFAFASGRMFEAADLARSAWSADPTDPLLEQLMEQISANIRANAEQEHHE